MSISYASEGITAAIKKDHEELKEYYNNYKIAPTEKDQTEWANQFRWELARHAVGEELLLYPAFEKHLGAEGKEIAKEDRAEHEAAKLILYDLEKLRVTDGDYSAKFQKLIDDLTVHMQSEETNDLPKLENAISRDESIALAKRFTAIKKFVPTRAHPSLPDNGGLFETAAGLAAAPIDKLRDLFTPFPQTA